MNSKKRQNEYFLQGKDKEKRRHKKNKSFFIQKSIQKVVFFIQKSIQEVVFEYSKSRFFEFINTHYNLYMR